MHIVRDKVEISENNRLSSAKSVPILPLQHTSVSLQPQDPLRPPMKTHNHSHDHEGHEGGHTPSLRPVTGLGQHDIQPRGNSAQQEALSSSEDWCPDYVQDVCDMGMDVWQWAFGEDWWADFKAAKTSERQTKALEAWRNCKTNSFIVNGQRAICPAQYRSPARVTISWR